MDRYRFLDIDVTCLDGLSSKPSSLPLLFKTRFYAVVSVTTPASALVTSQETPLANPLINKTHAWKNSPPLRFNAEVSNFHDDCSMLMIQLRKRRPFRADKDVGEPLIVPVIELFESAEYEKASLSNAVVYGIEYYANYDKDFRKKKRQVYLYFSYKFSNSTSAVGREVRIDGGGDSGVSAAAWPSDSKVARKYRDTHQRFYSLEDINHAVYHLLLFR